MQIYINIYICLHTTRTDNSSKNVNSNIDHTSRIHNNHSNKLFIQMFIRKLVKVVIMKIVTGHDPWFI